MRSPRERVHALFLAALLVTGLRRRATDHDRTAAPPHTSAAAPSGSVSPSGSASRSAPPTSRGCS